MELSLEFSNAFSVQPECTPSSESPIGALFAFTGGDPGLSQPAGTLGTRGKVGCDHLLLIPSQPWWLHHTVLGDTVLKTAPALGTPPGTQAQEFVALPLPMLLFPSLSVWNGRASQVPGACCRLGQAFPTHTLASFHWAPAPSCRSHTTLCSSAQPALSWLRASPALGFLSFYFTPPEAAALTPPCSPGLSVTVAHRASMHRDEEQAAEQAQDGPSIPLRKQ